MNIFDVEKMAKDVLRNHGSHKPQFLIEDKDKKIIVVLAIFRNQKEKAAMRAAIKKMIQNYGSERYWFIRESWFSKISKDDNKPFIMPRMDLNRSEALIVSEYQKDGTQITRMTEFKRDGDKIIFGKTKKLQEFKDLWNAFVDEEDTLKLMNDFSKKQTDRFFENLTKEAMKRFGNDLKNAVENNDREKFIVIMRNIHEFREKEKERIDKTTLEDVEEEDENNSN